jgi:hypothetical protein
MKIKEGDEVNSILDGKDYVITRIVGKRVILKSKKGEKEIITGMDSLKIFLQEKGERQIMNDTIRDPPPRQPIWPSFRYALKTLYHVSVLFQK